MNFSDKLRIHLSGIISGVPFGLSQMERLIEAVPRHQQSIQQNTMLRMLAIAHQIATQPHKIPQFDALGLILKGLVHKAAFSQPMCYLASCDFQAYHQYSTQSQSEDIQKVSRLSYGLYPLNYPGLDLPVSIYLQKGSGATNGNPHWFTARTALKEFYNIKGSNMFEKVKEMYLFLLSDQRLLHQLRKDAFKSFWASIYIRYNTKALEPYLEEDGNQKTSWLKLTQSQTINSTKTYQTNMTLDQRILYYLALAILQNYQQYKNNLSYNPFISAFTSFLKAEKDFSPWYYLMSLLIFHLMAQHLKLAGISYQCINKFKVFANKPSYTQDATPFIYFFLSEEEILSFATQNQVQFWKTPMAQQLKPKVAYFQTLNGVFFKQTLGYMQKQLFLNHILKSPFLPVPNIGLPLINRLQRQQQFIVLTLQQLTNTLNQETIRDYRTFIETWKSYYQLLQINSLQLAECALTDNSSFHPNNKLIFLMPKDSNEAAFNIVIRIARAYRAKVDYMEQVPALRQKKEIFQNQIFPKVSLILTEQQCDQFWKEWVQVLNHDPQFVGEIMKIGQ